MLMSRLSSNFIQFQLHFYLCFNVYAYIYFLLFSIVFLTINIVKHSLCYIFTCFGSHALVQRERERERERAYQKVLEAFGDDESVAPVCKDTDRTGEAFHIRGENLGHHEPRDWSPAQRKSYTRGGM